MINRNNLEDHILDNKYLEQINQSITFADAEKLVDQYLGDIIIYFSEYGYQKACDWYNDIYKNQPQRHATIKCIWDMQEYKSYQAELYHAGLRIFKLENEKILFKNMNDDCKVILQELLKTSNIDQYINIRIDNIKKSIESIITMYKQITFNNKHDIQDCQISKVSRRFDIYALYYCWQYMLDSGQNNFIQSRFYLYLAKNEHTARSEAYQDFNNKFWRGKYKMRKTPIIVIEQKVKNGKTETVEYKYYIPEWNLENWIKQEIVIFLQSKTSNASNDAKIVIDIKDIEDIIYQLINDKVYQEQTIERYFEICAKYNSIRGKNRKTAQYYGNTVNFFKITFNKQYSTISKKFAMKLLINSHNTHNNRHYQKIKELVRLAEQIIANSRDLTP